MNQNHVKPTYMERKYLVLEAKPSYLLCYSFGLLKLFDLPGLTELLTREQRLHVSITGSLS
jgi:hypothetical protein